MLRKKGTLRTKYFLNLVLKKKLKIQIYLEIKIIWDYSKNACRRRSKGIHNAEYIRMSRNSAYNSKRNAIPRCNFSRARAATLFLKRERFICAAHHLIRSAFCRAYIYIYSSPFAVLLSPPFATLGNNAKICIWKMPPLVTRLINHRR